MTVDEFISRYEDTVQNTCGWMIDETGVWRTDKNDKGKITTTYACRCPIVPTCLYCNMDSGIEKVELHYLKKGEERRIIVNRDTISNKNNIIRLANDGVEVNSDSAGALMKYLTAAITSNDATIPYKRSKSVMGWVGDEFVPYSKKIDCDNDEQFKNIQECLSAHGDHDEWIQRTKEWRKNKYFRLIMDASFASPIIEKVGENPFVLMLWGGTGSGKTVAMEVAMSIWGNPYMGKMTRTMNMTANSMMATASFLKNIPFGGDELQLIKSKFNNNYDQMIMQVTEGVDRGRLNSNSQIREMRSWKCSFIFTGEEPVTKQASGGGVKNRVIEIECKDKIVLDGNKVVNFVWENYGLVAEEFIAAINTEAVRKEYHEVFNDIITAFDTTDKQAGAMALILVADRIASSTIYGWEEPLLLADIEPFLCKASDVDNAERAYQYICGLISEHSNNFESDTFGPLWGTMDGDYVFMNAKVLNEQMQNAGFDMDACKRAWVDRGYLSRDSMGKYQVQKKINGTNTRCYKLKIFDDGNT